MGSVHGEHGASARRDLQRTPAGLALHLQRTAGNRATARLLGRRVLDPRARTAAKGQDDSRIAYERQAGSAFVRGAGEHVSGVDANDVIQGSLNDCGFLSSIMATARINPTRIRNMITPIEAPAGARGDGRRFFEVTLYARGRGGVPEERKVQVDDRFYTRTDGKARYAQQGDVGSGGPELWVMLLEKAWAALRGGYDNTQWVTSGDVLMAITGQQNDASIFVDFISDEQLLKFFTNAVRQGKPIIIQTKAQFSRDDLTEMQGKEFKDNGWKLVDRHVYNVAAADLKRKTVDMMNPHGQGHLRGFPVAKLRQLFDNYVIASKSVR